MNSKDKGSAMNIDPRTVKMAKAYYHEAKANYENEVSLTSDPEKLLMIEARCSSRMESLLLHLFAMLEIQPVKKVEEYQFLQLKAAK